MLHAVRDSNVQARLLMLVKALCSSPSHLGKGVASTSTAVSLTPVLEKIISSPGNCLRDAIDFYSLLQALGYSATGV